MIDKINIVFISIVLFAFSVGITGQNNILVQKVNNRVDSLFITNLDKMNWLVKNNKIIDDNTVDRYFVMLLVKMSNINCYAIDYSGFNHFTSNEVDLWRTWYEKNKNTLDSTIVFRQLDSLRQNK